MLLLEELARHARVLEHDLDRVRVLLAEHVELGVAAQRLGRHVFFL